MRLNPLLDVYLNADTHSYVVYAVGGRTTMWSNSYHLWSFPQCSPFLLLFLISSENVYAISLSQVRMYMCTPFLLYLSLLNWYFTLRLMFCFPFSLTHIVFHGPLNGVGVSLIVWSGHHVAHFFLHIVENMTYINDLFSRSRSLGSLLIEICNVFWFCREHGSRQNLHQV